MYKHVFDLLKKAIGAALILIGIMGLFLPIIPGALLIVAGLLILGVKKETLKRWMSRTKKWFKNLKHKSRQ